MIMIDDKKLDSKWVEFYARFLLFFNAIRKKFYFLEKQFFLLLFFSFFWARIDIQMIMIDDKKFEVNGILCTFPVIF